MIKLFFLRLCLAPKKIEEKYKKKNKKKKQKENKE